MEKEIQLDKGTSIPIRVNEITISPLGIGQLTGAIAKARLEFDVVKKTANNPFFKSKYADLETIISATSGPLSRNEVFVFQAPGLSDQDVSVTTIIAHSSGEWIQSTVSGPGQQKVKEGAKFDLQTVGSAITYLRRYALQSLLNLAAEDDDGNEASNKKQEVREGVKNYASLTKASAMPRIAAGSLSEPDLAPKADEDGLPVGDKDLPKSGDPLPTSEEAKEIGTKLRSFKQDSRTLRSFVERRASTEWKAVTKKQFDDIIKELESSSDITNLISKE